MAANIESSQAGCMPIIGLLTLFILGMPFGVAQAAKVDQWKFCTGTKEVSAEQNIAACSTIIDTKGISGLDLARALNRRGLAYLSKREFDSAARDFEQATKASAQLTNAYNNLAEALRYKGDFNGAFSAVKTFIRLDLRAPAATTDVVLSGLHGASLHVQSRTSIAPSNWTRSTRFHTPIAPPRGPISVTVIATVRTPRTPYESIPNTLPVMKSARIACWRNVSWIGRSWKPKRPLH